MTRHLGTSTGITSLDELLDKLCLSRPVSNATNKMESLGKAVMASSMSIMAFTDNLETFSFRQIVFLTWLAWMDRDSRERTNANLVRVQERDVLLK